MKKQKAIRKKMVCLLCIAITSFAVAQEWIQLGNDIALGDGQSWQSISLSPRGNCVAFSATDAPGSGDARGRVLIHEYIDGNWIQLGADIDGEANFDASRASSISISEDGRRVAIGAPDNDGIGDRAGHVRVFEYITGEWVQLGADIDGEAAGDWSGKAVSLSADGNRVAIGAPGNGDNAGHVRIYAYSSETWVQLGVDIDGDDIGARCGTALSLSADGNRVAIGAPEYRLSPMGSADLGLVRVYEYTGGNWIQVGADFVGDWTDKLGYSVSLSSDGNRVAFGTNGRYARIFEYNTGNWDQLGTDIEGVSYVSLSSDGSRVAVSAPRKVYVYTGGNWVQLGTANDDESIAVKSLSSDGNRVAVTAGSSVVRVFELGLPPLGIKDGNLQFISTSNLHYSVLTTTDLNTDFEVLTTVVGNGASNSVPIDTSSPQRFYKHRWNPH